MNTQICISVNEISCIRLPEYRLFGYIHEYATEYGFLWWHNERNVFKYWLAHKIARKGHRAQKTERVTVDEFDLKNNLAQGMDQFFVHRLSRN